MQDEPLSLEIIPADDDFDYNEQTQSLDKKLTDRFPQDFLSILKKIANEVCKVGLTEKEACMICDFDHARFVTLKQNEPLVRQLFDRKNLEYKRSLLKPLSLKAQTDDKLAQWLLESRFPEDFSKKRRLIDDPTENDLGSIITVIQQETTTGANASGLIKTMSSRAVLIGKGVGSPAPEFTAHEILKKKGNIIERLENAIN